MAKDEKEISSPLSILTGIPMKHSNVKTTVAAVIKDGVIENIIVVEPSKVKNFGAIICPDDIRIGDFYDEKTKKWTKKPELELEKQLKEELENIELSASQLRIAIKRAEKYNKLMDELKKEENDEYEIMWEYNAKFARPGPFLQWFKKKFYRSEKKFEEFLVEAEKIDVG